MVQIDKALSELRVMRSVVMQLQDPAARVSLQSRINTLERLLKEVK
jgi:hypothetical protein